MMWRILTAQIRRDLQYGNKQRTLPRRIERIPRGNKGNRRSSIH